MKTVLCKTYDPLEYGGSLLTTRYGRSRPRPLSTRDTIHLVIRSTRATGACSLRQPRNRQMIDRLLTKFAARFGVGVVESANNHNHLHLQILIRSRTAYVRFIRAFTGAVALAMGIKKFWDQRPYTRIARGLLAARRLSNYIKINQLEGMGCDRDTARFILAMPPPEYG